MKVEDIKRGDILVANYFFDDSIIFIAAGNVSIQLQNYHTTFASIPTIALINLSDNLDVGGKIGFTIRTYKPPKLSKPTLEQYFKLMNYLNRKEYVYNKRLKKLFKNNTKTNRIEIKKI